MRQRRHARPGACEPQDPVGTSVCGENGMAATTQALRRLSGWNDQGPVQKRVGIEGDRVTREKYRVVPKNRSAATLSGTLWNLLHDLGIRGGARRTKLTHIIG